MLKGKKTFADDVVDEHENWFFARSGCAWQTNVKL